MIRFCFSATYRLPVCFLALFVATESAATISSPTGPASSTTGDYTILYPVHEEDQECETILLEEKLASESNWSTVSDPDHDGEAIIVGKSTGDYQYRSHAYCEDYYGEYSWDEYSSSITVVVCTSSEDSGLQAA